MKILKLLIVMMFGMGLAQAHDLAYGDFNGDGRDDIFYADGSSWIVAYNGSNGWHKINSSAATLKDIKLGDINGDGITDVFFTTTAGYAGSGWYVSYGGTSGWNFLNHSSAMIADGNLELADMNGDGRDDVFFTTPNGYAGSGWYVSYGGTSGWNFLASSSAMLGDGNVALADLNGDGDDDVFFSTPNGYAGSGWYVSYSGTSGWNYLNHSSAMLANKQIALGDMDGDGRADVFHTNGSGWYVSYNGTGGWVQLNSSAATLHDIALPDLDGDGRADVFYTTPYGYAGSGWYASYGGTTGWNYIFNTTLML